MGQVMDKGGGGGGSQTAPRTHPLPPPPPPPTNPTPTSTHHSHGAAECFGVRVPRALVPRCGLETTRGPCLRLGQCRLSHARCTRGSAWHRTCQPCTPHRPTYKPHANGTTKGLQALDPVWDGHTARLQRTPTDAVGLPGCCWSDPANRSITHATSRVMLNRTADGLVQRHKRR